MNRWLSLVVAAVMLTAVFAAFDPSLEVTKCCSCLDLMPRNVPADSAPQVMPAPYKIIVHAETYRPNEEIEVELVAEGDYTFRDFILVAWPTDNRPKSALGRFELLGSSMSGYTKIPACYSNQQQSYGIRTADFKPKKHMRFSWTTNKFEGHIEFRATFIQGDYTYWVAEKSELLVDPRDTAPPLPKQIKPKLTPYINVEECGRTKGCFREPAGCSEPYCEYIVTWQEADLGGIRFELGGLADNAKDRFVAVALSNDTYMGSDMVFACAHNSDDDSTGIYLSYNDHNRNIPVDLSDEEKRRKVLTNMEGSYHQGRLRCRFTVSRDIDLQYYEVPRIADTPYHLLLARGFANRGRLKRHGLGVNELPIATSDGVILSRYSNIDGRARYPLVKAHGCLMILAWIFFASIGLLMTKYYKPMWPNKRMFDQRYWFVAHFNCMAMAFLITIIGIILIFIEADGWSQAPDLPQRAHPILGIIIFICIIINPIIALIRPSEQSKWRPVFNWFHWAFGTIANVLAIPQIFIGMDFGKANVPWWATWIVVIWVIIHIAIELSLEIHQCCTYKKNKERRRKYEQQKRENPKMHIDEPEPAGRRFKRFMLFLHLTVTTIVTLIMIIVIAVA